MQQSPKTPPKSKKAAEAPLDNPDAQKITNGIISNRDGQHAESPSQKSSRQKNNPYGLSPGVSPYPTYPHPTPEECQEVNDILAKKHGAVQQPKTIPQPSLNDSGCGEVPSVLDALIRTRLSAATNNANSSRAFRGLVERFGIIKEGVGKLTGDAKLEGEGKADKAAGKVENAVGGAKDTARDALDKG